MDKIQEMTREEKIREIEKLRINDINKNVALEISENINIKFNGDKISNISFFGNSIDTFDSEHIREVIIYCLMYDYVDLLSIMFENLSLIKSMSQNTNKVIERVNSKQKD